MWDIIPGNYLVVMVILAVVSVVFCSAQILLKKKIRLLTVCKVTIFLPLMSVIINVVTDVSDAYMVTVHVNDLSTAAINRGVATALTSISLGLCITIFLALFYAITVDIYKNQY